MNRPQISTLRVFASLAVVAGIGLAGSNEASAQEVVVTFPDPGYIAAAEPVYYNGIPHYWYRDRWYYRTPGGWAWYHEGEPRYLHDYRYRVWPGGVYHPGYHYGAHGGWHGHEAWHRR